MQVYKVSAVLKYSPFFSLTYVSKFDFEIGEIVPIDFNNRKISGIVLEKYSIKDAKVEIRKADFQTKKIESKGEGKFLEKKLFECLHDFSNKWAIPVGELCYFLFGELPPSRTRDLSRVRDGGEKFSTYTLFPDELSLKTSEEENAVKAREVFEKLFNREIETLVIKDFNFDKYINFQAPHISKIDLLFSLLECRVLDLKKITLETEFLGVAETVWVNENIKKGKLFGKILIDVKENNHKAKKYLAKVGRDQNGEEEILATEVLEKISDKQKTFLFVLSHGFADRIFCNDCKKSYDCENCGHPYSILNEEDGRFLYCKSCKNKKILKEDQYVICKHCGSWRVFPFGIGGQKVLDFLKRELPLPGGGINPPAWQGEFLLIDESEKKLSAKKIKESVKNFLNGDTNILIGSLRTLKVLKTILKLPRHTATPSKEGELVDKTIVVSTGPLVRGKYFDSDEKLLKLISELESISKELYVNKHEGDEVSLENYKDKNKFIEEEIEFRKTTNLPPFYKVLTLIFSYKEKRIVDKFLSADLEKFKISGEIKKGNKFIYYWFISNDFELIKFVEILRQFGDVFLANSIIEQSIMKK